MIKFLFAIIFLWIIYRIKFFITDIQISKSKNHNKERINPKSRMDIQDADYEEVE